MKLNWNFQKCWGGGGGGGEGGLKRSLPRVGEVWIFSGIAHLEKYLRILIIIIVGVGFVPYAIPRCLTT